MTTGRTLAVLTGVELLRRDHCGGPGGAEVGDFNLHIPVQIKCTAFASPLFSSVFT